MKFLSRAILDVAIVLLCFAPVIPLNTSEALRQLNSEPWINIARVMDDLISTDLFYRLEDGKYEFSCSALFQKALIGQSSILPPPETIPPDLLNAFSLNNLIDVAYYYFADDVVEAYLWENEVVDQYRALPPTCGVYKSPVCEDSSTKYHHAIDGKVGLVLGSLAPWAEALLLNHGAAKLITVEYSKLITSYPNITVMTPVELAESYLSGNFSQVDFIFSFSSIEHDGLGRYGDPLNPFGDLETLSRLHCLLKPGGVMFFGVPTGADLLVWNAGRFYGKYRLFLLFQHWWSVLDFFHFSFINLSLIRDESVDFGTYEEAMWVIQKAVDSS